MCKSRLYYLPKYSIDSKTKWLAISGKFSYQLQFFTINLFQNISNLVFKSFPQITILPLFFAFVGIINSSGFRNKVPIHRYIFESFCEFIILSNRTLDGSFGKKMKLTINKTDYKPYFWQFRFLGVPKQGKYITTCWLKNFSMEKIVRWDPVGGSEGSTFGDTGVGISTRTMSIWSFAKFSQWSSIKRKDTINHISKNT